MQKGAANAVSSEYTTTNEPAVNPLEPVEQLMHWLLTTTIHLAIGLVIGLIAAQGDAQPASALDLGCHVALAVVIARRSLGGGCRLDTRHGGAVRDRARAALAP